MNEFNIIPFWFSIGKLWPLVFVAIGVSFILKSKRKDAWEEWKKQNPTSTDAPANPSTGEGSVEDNTDDRFTKKDI
ncbi:hypothetical protein [Pedobacter steynii]